jgi:transposase-like protein
MNTLKRYTREDRGRMVRLVFDQQGQHSSPWSAILSISGKLGCTAETLWRWVRQSERDQGKRSGVPSADQDRLKNLNARIVSLNGQ